MNDNEFARLISNYFDPHFPQVRIEHAEEAKQIRGNWRVMKVTRVYANEVEPEALGSAVLMFRRDVVILTHGKWNGESFVSWDEVQG